jgi:hypothetical protein
MHKVTFLHALLLDAWFLKVSQFQMATQVSRLPDYRLTNGTRGWLFRLRFGFRNFYRIEKYILLQ